jgi:hypothetical protein
MEAPSELLRVEGGDHSLQVGVRALRATGRTQAQEDERVLAAIRAFLAGLAQRPARGLFAAPYPPQR